MGFESGNFSGWTCSTGRTYVNGNNNVIQVSVSSAQSGIHTLLKNNSGQDLYGKFSIASPNGSKHVLKLGNDGVNAQAERVSYTFTVPSSVSNYSITYYYAVVFEDPAHPAPEQPRFAAKVTDVSSGEIITCASFDFIATANLPGFKKSSVNNTVLYKDWSPVTINLSGYAGKTIKLEFSTADCAPGGHFGYAYIDVDEGCLAPIIGNAICSSQESSLTLSGPSGFEKYNWYNHDMSRLLGSSQNLLLDPLPAVGTVYKLEVIPYLGFGCVDVLSTTVTTSSMDLNVNNPPGVCFPATVDLTDAAVTTGSSSDVFLTYWRDAAATDQILDPSHIAVSGTYYIKATNLGGCRSVKPVKVSITPPPNVVISQPGEVCAPAVIDLTAPAIVSGSDGGLTYTYWADQAHTQPVADPKKISVSGTYYIYAQTGPGCGNVHAVKVVVHPLPVFSVDAPQPVCFPARVDLAGHVNVPPGQQHIALSYFKNAALTESVANPSAIEESGTYFIRATSPYGCTVVKQALVVINALPVIAISDPRPVYQPKTADLTNAGLRTTTDNTLMYTYWRDEHATLPLENPSRVTESGTFYVKVSTPAGCMRILPVKTIVAPLPQIQTPTAFTPAQPTNNVLYPFLTGVKNLYYFKIFNKWGNLVYQTADADPAKGWNGVYNGALHFMETYTWYAEGIDEVGNKVKRSGNTILLR